MTSVYTPGQCLGTSDLFSSSRCQTELVPESPYYGVEMTCNAAEVIFQEFHKYVLGPRFGRSVSNKHARLLYFEGLDNPLVSEVEDQNDACTLWEFLEEAMEPTLPFQMHTYVSRELGADGDSLEETNVCSLMSSSPSPKSSPSPSPPTLSPPSSIQESTPSSSHECFAKGVSSSLYFHGRTVLDIYQRIVLDLDKKTVMDLDRRNVLDLSK